MIQGSAADLIKRAMLAVDRRIRDAGLQARMLLQIHDELVFEAPEAEIPALAALVREAMTTALDLDVPLKVDIAAGPNWLDVEPDRLEPRPAAGSDDRSRKMATTSGTTLQEGGRLAYK